jgi:hypothetical protein
MPDCGHDTASATTLTIRVTTFSPAPPIFARCSIATARPETQVYIAMLSPMIGDWQSDDRTVPSFDLIAWARATLFATHPETPPNVELPAANVQPDPLPSVRPIVDLSALSPQSEGLFVDLASGDRPQ